MNEAVRKDGLGKSQEECTAKGLSKDDEGHADGDFFLGEDVLDGYYGLHNTTTLTTLQNQKEWTVQERTCHLQSAPPASAGDDLVANPDTGRGFVE